MPYEYDVFFSYKRDPESDDWHLRVKEKIKFWLHNELNRDCEIFFDTENITVGSRWRRKIADALLHSRCLVCIWSPMYFQSKWCVAEWHTFEQRCKQYDADLVLPAQYHDGKHYPKEATERQMHDFRNYANTIPVFWETREALEFETNEIRPFVSEVAQAIEAAPDFSEDFPLMDEPPPSLVTSRPSIKRFVDG